MRQGLCTFIRQVGEPQALSQVFEIKTLIYTAVAPTFPGDGARKGGNPKTWASCTAATPVGGRWIAESSLYGREVPLTHHHRQVSGSPVRMHFRMI